MRIDVDELDMYGGRTEGEGVWWGGSELTIKGDERTDILVNSCMSSMDRIDMSINRESRTV